MIYLQAQENDDGIWDGECGYFNANTCFSQCNNYCSACVVKVERMCCSFYFSDDQKTQRIENCNDICSDIADHNC